MEKMKCILLVCFPQQIKKLIIILPLFLTSYILGQAGYMPSDDSVRKIPVRM